MTAAIEDVIDHNPFLARHRDDECLATWWHQATPGTTYWRCLVPARHLPGQTIPFTYEAVKVIEETGQPVLPWQRGVAVWQFLGDGIRTRMALGLRELWGTPTFMEVDDNYTRPAPYMKGKGDLNPWKPTIEEAGDGYSNEMHRECVPLMDGIICSTEYLADVYRQFSDNVHICPNSIDPQDWEFERGEDDGVFRIVYYGSPSHLVDAPIVTRALKWASRQPGVEIWTVGFTNPAWGFAKTVPWARDLPEAREVLFRFDLGIAPLKGNPWSRGKSDIKAMEYAMAGALPLMSLETPFQGWFEDWPGLVLEDGEWLDKIKFYVTNRDSVRETIPHVRDWVLEHRSIQKTIPLWREALNV